MDEAKDVATLFEKLGGEPVLRAVIDQFVEAMYADVMIGFLFRHFDKDRLKRHEYQFTARALGLAIPYEGRPIREAHAAHPILGGQFSRRKVILRDALLAHGAPAEVVTALMEHTEKLRPLVTAQRDASACVQQGMQGPLVTSWRPDPT
jgi:hemoglobin